MANVVAYPGVAYEKSTRLDPCEDAQDFFNLIQRKIKFSLGKQPPDPDPQAVYEAKSPVGFRLTRTYGSMVLIEAKDKNRKRIEVENIKRQR